MAAPPPPPPYYDTNLVVDFHENRQVGINATAWLCTSVAICTVAMKVFTKARIVKIVGWDDFIILFSLALSIISSSLVSSSVTTGLGRHTAAVLAEPDGAQRLVNTTYKLQVGYALHIGAFSLPNIAIALLVVQLLDRNVGRAWALYVLVGVQAGAAVAAMGVVLAQCGAPARGRWAWWWEQEKDMAESSCWDPAVFNDFSYFVAAYTAFTDAVLAAVPVAAFWRLQMPARTKLGVCLLMGLTLLSAIVTVVKSFYLHLFTDVVDPLWNVVPLVIWSLIEQNVVIVAACIPTLRPMFSKGVLLPTHHHSPSGAQQGPSSRESFAWLDPLKTLHAMKTKNGHRRLFSVWGDGSDGGGGGSGCRKKPWRPRAVSTSEGMPLHQVHRPGGARHHGSPHQQRHHTADTDDASHKGIVRTVAVDVEWNVAAPAPARRPLSAQSARTDWLMPLPPMATAAAEAEGVKEGGFYTGGEETYTRRIVI